MFGSENLFLKANELFEQGYKQYKSGQNLKKAVQLVFHNRKTSLKKLPITFSKDAFKTLEKNWNLYRKKIKIKKNFLKLPESIEDVISILNQWLQKT